QPSTPGIDRSIRITSGSSAATAASALCPSSASITRKPECVSMPEKILRLCGLSSTSNTVLALGTGWVIFASLAQSCLHPLAHFIGPLTAGERGTVGIVALIRAVVGGAGGRAKLRGSAGKVNVKVDP